MMNWEGYRRNQVLIQHLSRRAEENHEKTQSGQKASSLRMFSSQGPPKYGELITETFYSVLKL